jgi:hypothetical protein
VKATALVMLALVSPVAADPVRLRADALASTRSPAGLLVLEADGAMEPGLSAEAVVWVGGIREPEREASGDVLVIAVRARDRLDRATAQLGRFVAMLGALRPTHVDGASGRVRLPKRIDVEAFAGVPVVPTVVDASRSWDWIAGGRVGRRIGDYGSAGIAYAQRRDGGRLASEEVGVDVGTAFGPRHDLGARLAYDLVDPGIAEASLRASRRSGTLRTELYARHRSASHLLPATSLFSVLGDVPSQRAGAVITWRAAPRLDMIADVSGRRIDDELDEELVGRARLRLDDKGTSAIAGEVRRTGGRDAWTGVRGVAQVAVSKSVTLATELELVIPDEDRGAGSLWPWALVAATWKRGAWESAIAIEASASPEFRHRVDGLLQLSRRWSTP